LTKRLIAFTHFSRIGILTQLDSGQPAFQALHGDHSRIRISKEEDRIKKKEENCDTPNVTIESKIFKNFEEEEQHQQDLQLKNRGH
jgi:hypothetical protein